MYFHTRNVVNVRHSSTVRATLVASYSCMYAAVRTKFSTVVCYSCAAAAMVQEALLKIYARGVVSYFYFCPRDIKIHDTKFSTRMIM
jgi:hypothetical protein